MKIYIWNEEFKYAEDVERLIVSLCPKEDYTEIEIEEAVAKFPNVPADHLDAFTEFCDTRNFGEYCHRGALYYYEEEILAAQEWARARGEDCKVWLFYKCNELEEYVAEFNSIDAEKEAERLVNGITESVDISLLIDNYFSDEKPSEELEESDPDEYERLWAELDEKVYKWFDELSPSEKLAYASGDWSCTVLE